MKVVYILLKLYLRFFLFNDQIKGQCQVCAYNICVENRVCKDEKKKKKKELMEFFPSSSMQLLQQFAPKNCIALQNSGEKPLSFNN